MSEFHFYSGREELAVEPVAIPPLTYTIVDEGSGYSRVESKYAILRDVDNDTLSELAGTWLAMGSQVVFPKHWPRMSEKPRSWFRRLFG